MGLRPSPNVSVRGMLWLKEESHGDPSDPEKVFRWERVGINLPGHEDYAPNKSWVKQAALERYPRGGLHLVCR